ncbi:MAG: SPOR domain-containing protein [Gallionellaceae bacterium]|nr:SPOR domain-containing protein [Gallionellaceae bacterium]
MSRNSSNRSASPRKGGSLLAGILVGMVLGLIIAGGVAWYILKTPSPFVNKEPREAVRLVPDAAKPVPAKIIPVPESAVAAASGVDESKPRFEFYKVLTDKQDATASAPKSGGKAVADDGKPAPDERPAGKAAKETYFLQAGAFSSADDADKLKARLAMLGMEASVQAATAPGKGVVHRVRLGPYKGADEMNKTLEVLKQNGVNATPIRAQ